MNPKRVVKRGERSNNYFQLSYVILLAIFIGLISVLPEIYWIVKVILILIISILFYLLCFWNNWFRNKIVGIFNKLEDKEESYN